MRRTFQVFAAAASLLTFGHAASAGLTIVSQERSVSVELTDNGSTSGSPTQTDADAATGNGPFSGQARARRTGPGVNNQVDATMQSNLGGNTWTFRGLLDIDLDDQRELISPTANARFTARVEFAIDAPYTFDLSGGVTLSGSNPGNGQLVEMIEGVSPGAPSPMGDRTGTLPAGTYRLTLAQEIDSSERDADYRSDYNYTFSLSDGNGNGGTPNPVPLPAAVWSGLALMGATGLTGAVRRRLRRA